MALIVNDLLNIYTIATVLHIEGDLHELSK